VAEMLGGRCLDSSTSDPGERRLRDVVEEMAIASGLPVPDVYVLDRERDFVDRYNHELIDIQRITSEHFDIYRQHLRELIETHARLTGSAWSAHILDHFRDHIGKFWLAKPKAADLDSLADELRRAA